MRLEKGGCELSVINSERPGSTAVVPYNVSEDSCERVGRLPLWSRISEPQRKMLCALFSCTASIAWGSIMAGALQACEAPAELDMRRSRVAAFDASSDTRRAHINALFKELESNAAALAHLVALEVEITGMAGARPVGDVQDWTFIGALYYSYSIMSTIGYGTFYAITKGGQLLTLTLGLIGIASFGVSIALVCSAVDSILDSILNTITQRRRRGAAQQQWGGGHEGAALTSCDQGRTNVDLFYCCMACWLHDLPRTDPGGGGMRRTAPTSRTSMRSTSQVREQ